jgi:Arc/MetJ-type ribon-helix-helix transcriptional regulator
MIGAGRTQLAKKYTTVSIPQPLHAKIERLISKKPGFKSVSDYVTYVLREVVAMHETKEVPDPFTSEDIEEIKQRLKALGYL